jgi:hypothetical protein
VSHGLQRLFHLIFDGRDRFEIVCRGERVFLEHTFKSVFNDLGHEACNITRSRLISGQEQLGKFFSLPFAEAGFVIRRQED